MSIKFWGLGGETKAERCERLEKKVIYLEKYITDLTDTITDTSIAEGRSFAQHRTEISNITNSLNSEIRQLNREISVLRENYDIDVDNARTDVLNKNEKAEAERERKYNDRVRKLEKEHAEKMGKCDRALESDKSSYRKYLRTEFNKTIDTLTAENKRLVTENAKLIGENKSLEGSREFFKGSQEVLVQTVKGLTAALPEIKAAFTTPEITVNAGSTTQKSNGGEQKKN